MLGGYYPVPGPQLVGPQKQASKEKKSRGGGLGERRHDSLTHPVFFLLANTHFTNQEPDTGLGFFLFLMN